MCCFELVFLAPFNVQFSNKWELSWSRVLVACRMANGNSVPRRGYLLHFGRDLRGNDFPRRSLCIWIVGVRDLHDAILWEPAWLERYSSWPTTCKTVVVHELPFRKVVLLAD